MPWRPRFPGDWPTLGYQIADRMTECLAMPDRLDYEPYTLTDEMVRFIAEFYRLDPGTGRRRYRRGMLGRGRGWGKSPIGAGLACAEALFDVVPDGWDSDGQPVGRPWSSIGNVLVQIAAVSVDQVERNTWAPLLEMLRLGPAVYDYPGLDPMDTYVQLPGGYADTIEQMTSSPSTAKGNRPRFVVCDQVEEWTRQNGGKKLAKTIALNLAKTDGSRLDLANAYTRGIDSVAEDNAKFAAAIAEGRTRNSGLLVDHRQADSTTLDMSSRESLLVALEQAYGDSLDTRGGWISSERMIAEAWDLGNDPEDYQRDVLNIIGEAGDAWITDAEWSGKVDATKVIADRDTIVIGFDGSRQRARGVTDATALIGCRVVDGHLFVLGVWEQPDGPAGQGWRVPVHLVNAEVDAAFSRYNVVGMYADPAKWESYIAKWEAGYGSRLNVKASRTNPIEWWMTGGRSGYIVRATRQLHEAITDPQEQMSHDGHPALHRHILNARRRHTQSGVQIMKESPESPRKIDAAVAAILAWQCRLDALGQGLGAEQRAGRRHVTRSR